MSNKRFSVRAIIITVIITLLLSSLLTMGVVALAARRLLGSGGLTMLEGIGLIRSRFVADYDEEAAVDEAMRGMVDALGDRWSVYLDAEQSAALNKTRQNAYVGIGIRYQKSDDPFGMEIMDVTSGGPAEEAGLTVGEIIVAVNGRTLTPENLDDLVGEIGGAEGAQVVLTLQDGDGTRREVTVTAAKVDDPPVEYTLLEGNVGYVYLENFFQNAADSTFAAVEDLIEQGAEGLVFDVRGNPGGYVTELTRLLDDLLPEGPIFAERSKNGPTHVTESDADCVDLPMVVLVDENSYSAAELFAAQLRESVGAKLVGKQTCGKGYYQQGFPLFNGGLLNISTGTYTTGGGVSLIGTGLTPDYVVEGAGAQMDKALEVIKAEMETR